EEHLALVLRQQVADLRDPTCARELRDPDHVEREHVKIARPAAQVDHVELMLLVARGRQRLGANANPWMPRLEFTQQRRERGGIAEQPEMLEDDRALAGALLRSLTAAPARGEHGGEHRESTQDGWDRIAHEKQITNRAARRPIASLPIRRLRRALGRGDESHRSSEPTSSR